jgi:hypothetical protein
MWNFIPQLFYDFLAKIVPGAILIVASAFVIFGPTNVATFIFNLNPSEKSNLFALGPLLLWFLVSYLIGFVLGQLWETTIGWLLKSKDYKLEKQCQEKRLEEHNRILTALGYPILSIKAKDLPPEPVMRDHIRHVDPSNAARLLKVKAEQRFCHVLILGLSVLVTLHVKYLWSQPQADRIALQVFLVIVIVACCVRSRRALKHLANGASIGWLVHTSSGNIPAKVPPK